jgi:hypothetical protein
MYKTKICGVDISVGDMFKDRGGNTCVVYKLWRVRGSGELVVSFYWISIYRNLCEDCVSGNGFAALFKKKIKI